MADTKITALAAITTVDPAADVLPIVDISDTSMAASGTTKKITSNQILGAGGTATLASATITGAATVGTTLGVTGAATVGTTLLVGTDATLTNGNVILGTSGKGIDFSATPNSSGTMTSELLNDYEEGTFTVSIATGATGVTYTSQIGRYTKIGRLVTVYFQLSVSASTRDGNQFIIAGLPFSSVTVGSGVIAYSDSGFIATAGGNKPNIYVSASNLEFYTSSGSSFTGSLIAADAFDLRVTATYYV